MLYSAIIIVDIDGGGDYTNIQDGIDNSEHGDTVLVYPGTYVENIDFNGKSIVLTSLELITEDASYIDSTIIDGGKQSSCIRLHNSEQNAVIQGFSITNGIGFDHINSGAGRPGGGIAIDHIQSECTIKNCKIYKNIATGGGGIYCYKSSMYLSGLIITENYASSGGGLSIQNQSSVTFDDINRCNLYNNYAGSGSDVLCYNTGNINLIVDTFTVSNPIGYFVEYSDEGAYAGDITLDIMNAWMEEVNHDLYVSPDGNDNNTGFSPDAPLKTIAWALHKIKSDSLVPKTVYVAEGTYSKALNNQIYPLGLKDYTALIGASEYNTVLFNDDFPSIVNTLHSKNNIFSNFTLIGTYVYLERIIRFSNCDTILIKDIIIKNCYIDENLLTNFTGNKCVFYDNIKFLNNTSEKVAGINHEKGNAYVRDCYFENNHSFGLAAQSYLNVNFRLRTYEKSVVANCTFLNNSNMSYEEAPFCFGGKQFYSPDVHIKNSLFVNNETPCPTLLDAVPSLPTPDSLDINITNCTFVDNKSSSTTLSFMGAVDLTNTILWDSTEYEICLGDWSYHNMYATLNVKNCDIKNGLTGIFNMHPNNTINWLDGNIASNPQFVGGDPYNYELAWNSPCIDAGTRDTTGLNLPATDLAGNPRISGNRIDIGAYEWQNVSTDEEPLINDLITFTNSPNPFSTGTRIVCSLKGMHKDDSIEISIYNVLGQLIHTFSRETENFEPYTEIYWDGTDKYGIKVSPGTYFCKLQYNGHAVVRKMVKVE